MIKNQPALLLLPFIFWDCTHKKNSQSEDLNNNYYTQANTNRTAEWEPTKGTMIVWPLYVPYKPAIEFAKDKGQQIAVSQCKTPAANRQLKRKTTIICYHH